MSCQTGIVVHRRAGGIDAIDEYSRRLVDALCARGVSVRYVPDGLASVPDDFSASWIFLQYNPFRYGWRGFAPGLMHDARRLRKRSRARLAVMVHEAWVDMTDWPTTVMGTWQRAQLRQLLRLADGVMTSTQALARELGGGAVHLPVPATITPVPASRESARARLGIEDKLVVSLFGRANPSRALDYAEAAIAAIAGARGSDSLAVLNLGADAPAIRAPAGVEVQSPGHLTAEELSRHLRASDLVLLPFADGVSTRRTTLMAALAHELPVLGLLGHGTDSVLTESPDAVVLTPVGDRTVFAEAAVKLAGDPLRLRAVGAAGRALYESSFDWPVLAGRAAAELADLGGVRRRRVVFVAHDVGGGGGMERQSERLVEGLLGAGRPVTVIARTCALAERPGLRVRRVPTPARPFALAYPAFFAVASVLAARRRGALLHTTGAIVANRADVSTVHYCHRAAADRVRGSRASRSGLLFWLNSTVSGVLSRAAEGWCYRPGRTRMLCAVSTGVARELLEGFPTMEQSVSTVPNGVDSSVFRPDPVQRASKRAELGLDQSILLALFVGGDWERKGLLHAVEALTLASDWELAVAGVGDPAPLVARARAAGTQSRLHFLGRVDDTPRLYAAADAFVLPTAYEAFPLVTLEAAASGLPLLVTRVSGVEELLTDGVSGWFIARDSSDIARRLNTLRSESDRVRAMGEHARAAASGYSWEAMTDGYLTLYEQLMNENPLVRSTPRRLRRARRSSPPPRPGR